MAPLVALLVPWLLKEVASKAFNSPDDIVPLQKKEYEVNEKTAGFIRHLLTAAGGILIAKGYADDATVSSLAGAIVTIAGFAWSLWAKREQ